MTATPPPRAARPLGPVILRVAGWPIEALEPLRASGFTARVDAWIAEDDAIATLNAALAAQIHAAVPTLADPVIRRAALALKRHLHAGTLPLPETLVAPLRQTFAPALDAVGRRCRAHARERAAIEGAHADEVRRADEALERITGDERFLRALCLASPTAFRQRRRADGGGMSRRSRRRLRATLYQYLMRAVGRATPSGLWAGIALEDVDGSLTAAPGMVAVAPADPIVRAGPDLSLFASALDTVSLLRLDEIRLRLNPTLRDTGKRGWIYGAFVDGAWEERRIDDHTPLRAVLGRFAEAQPFCLREVATFLAASDAAFTDAVAREIVAFWLRHGLIWSSIAFPAHYADPWQGLDAMVASLPEAERTHWDACRRTLRRLADDIEAQVDGWRAVRLRAALDSAREAAASLLSRYGLALPDDRDVLVVDRTAPFSFTVGDALIATATAELRSYWAFDRYGLGEIETRIGIRETFGTLPRGTVLSLSALLRDVGPVTPAPRSTTWEERVLSRASAEEVQAAQAAFARWNAQIAPAFAAREHRLAGLAERAVDGSVSAAETMPPGSALLLVGRGAAAPILRIGGLTSEPSFFHARFAHLFRGRTPRPDAFLAWLAAGWGDVEARWPSLRGCDLAIRNLRNANVAARPRLSVRFLDPLDEGGTLLRDATIRRGAGGRPVLMLAGDSATALLLPYARSAAVLGGLDRCAALLAAISTHLGRPPLLAPMPRLGREVSDWHHLPRLLLGETIVGPERWTPPEEVGRSLAEAKGAEGFIRWRRFVRRAGLPELVYTFQGRHRTETLLPTDSVLGVACLAADLAAHGPALRLQELCPAPEESFVRDAQGRHFIAELAVAWHADPAFWDRYVAAGATPKPETRMGVPSAEQRPEPVA